MERLKVCIRCGFTWGEAESKGLLGCASCYDSFGDELEWVLFWMHGNTGKSVHEQDSSEDRKEKLAELRERFSDAVRMENYEEAGRLKRILDKWDLDV